jgi:hypothetical protein
MEQEHLSAAEPGTEPPAFATTMPARYAFAGRGREIDFWRTARCGCDGASFSSASVAYG